MPSVNFINKTGFTETFTITDTNNNGSVVFSDSLDDQSATGSLPLVDSDAGFGEATYEYAGQITKPATGTGLLTDQDYEMY